MSTFLLSDGKRNAKSNGEKVRVCRRRWRFGGEERERDEHDHLAGSGAYGSKFIFKNICVRSVDKKKRERTYWKNPLTRSIPCPKLILGSVA